MSIHFGGADPVYVTIDMVNKQFEIKDASEEGAYEVVGENGSYTVKQIPGTVVDQGSETGTNANEETEAERQKRESMTKETEDFIQGDQNLGGGAYKKKKAKKTLKKKTKSNKKKRGLSRRK